MDFTDKFFDRDLARAVTAPVRDVAGPVLREVIDAGVAAFERCSATAEGLDTPLGILFPYLHLFEMLDAAEAVLDTGGAAPARVLLRAGFEAWLTFEYVIEEATEQRAAAYIVTDVHSRIHDLQRFDPSTGTGQAFRQAIAADQYGATVAIPAVGDLDQRIAGLRSVLAEPHLVDAAGEYLRTKAAMRRRPAFHSLWNGPKNVEQLARHLKRSGLYELLYRSSSKTAHATDLPRQLRDVDGTVGITRLRCGEGLINTYFHAISMGVAALHKVLRHYRPDELSGYFPRWYKERVRAGYWQLVPEARGKELPYSPEAG